MCVRFAYCVYAARIPANKIRVDTHNGKKNSQKIRFRYVRLSPMGSAFMSLISLIAFCSGQLRIGVEHFILFCVSAAAATTTTTKKNKKIQSNYKYRRLRFAVSESTLS